MVQKLTGLVLRTTEYKESDLILNILTREQGLISAKARGVRTNRSHNKGACQLLCYSEFTITDYKGFSAISEAFFLCPDNKMTTSLGISLQKPRRFRDPGNS